MTLLSREPLKALVLILITLLTSCSTTEYVVESDYSYAGTFHRYKSFSFGLNDNFGGSEEDRVLVEKYIGSTLRAWGYETDIKKPDIYIFYSLYYDDFEYRGYHQPQLQQWINHVNPAYGKELIEKEMALDSLDPSERKRMSRTSVKEEYNSVTYDLREGTMLIALIDRKKKKTIWQGYASGILGEDQAKNQRVLRSAIIRIMDEFKLLSHSS
ncbi:MAG: DUF4136 domain-containing protein [Cyclobacteriaceae bacterium]